MAVTTFMQTQLLGEHTTELCLSTSKLKRNIKDASTGEFQQGFAANLISNQFFLGEKYNLEKQIIKLRSENFLNCQQLAVHSVLSIKQYKNLQDTSSSDCST
jgi:hypothetical protein